MIFYFYVQLKIKPKFFSYRDFKSIDYDRLNIAFDMIDWNSIFRMDSINDQINYLQTNINLLFDTFVPFKKKIVKHNQRPWFNAVIKDLIIKRDTCYSRWKRYKTSEIYNSYKQLKNNVVSTIKASKRNFYETKFSSAIGDGKKTWKAIREIGIGRRNTLLDDSVDENKLNKQFVNIPMPLVKENLYANCENQLNSNDFFSFSCVTQCDVLESFLKSKSNATGFDGINPIFMKALLPKLLCHITYIFNTIITKSEYPVNWKCAKIIPIPKSSNEFRPIAILPYLSKIFERLMHRQISVFFDRHFLLTERQSGYRKKRSCTTALIDVTEDIRVDVDKGNISFLILLDHSKAFDTVDHQILTTKLSKMYGFTTSATHMITSYLCNRSQAVHVSTRTSELLPVSRGVPQGSILGPFLFSVYINDLPPILRSCKVHMYADDVQLYTGCELSSNSNCVSKINIDLDLINNWALKNGLCLNPKKSKCMAIYKKSIDISFLPKVELNGSSIEYVDKAKNLGITINKTLSWNDHINGVVGRVYGMLRTLWKSQSFTPLNIRLLLAKTYLVPTLLYGCELFANSDASSTQKLNIVYNNIARYIFNKKRKDHISEFSKKIFGMSFDNYLKYRSLILLQKIISTKQPLYLYNRLTFLKSNRSNKLLQLRHSSLMSERQYFIHSIRLWNALPSYLHYIISAEQFKNKLLIHFS